MAIYTFRIVGVHYAVNPDSTSREEETELMHQRTAQRLRELDEVRPPVVLIPEPSNPADVRAVMARVEGRRIGYVSTPQLDAVHALLSAQGGRPLKARIESVEAKKHGWMTVCVETNEEVCIAPQNQCDSVWKEWTCNLPVLPTIESQFVLMEAEAMLEDVLNRNAPDDVFSKHPISAPTIVTQSEAKSLDDIRVDGCVDASEILRRDAPLDDKHGEESVVNLDLLEQYIRLWLENSLHDLSHEARLTREHYIMRLKEMGLQNAASWQEAGQEGVRRNTVPSQEPPSQNATPVQEMPPQNENPSAKPLPQIRALVSELEKQRTAICGQKRMTLRTGQWWKELLASDEMDRLWKTWVARMGDNKEQSMSELDPLLRTLPNDLYIYIDDKKTFFSRLHYSGVPRKVYWQIVSLMLLRERTQHVSLHCNQHGTEREGYRETRSPLEEGREEGRQNESFTQIAEGGNEALYPWDREFRPQVEEGVRKSQSPQDEQTRNETFTVTIPKELQTPEAKKVLARLQKKGILDADLQPSTLKGWQKGILAFELAQRFGIKHVWAEMARMWKCNASTLRQYYSKEYTEPKSIEFSKKVKVQMY